MADRIVVTAMIQVGSNQYEHRVESPFDGEEVDKAAAMRAFEEALHQAEMYYLE